MPKVRHLRAVRTRTPTTVHGKVAPPVRVEPAPLTAAFPARASTSNRCRGRRPSLHAGSWTQARQPLLACSVSFFWRLVGHPFRRPAALEHLAAIARADLPVPQTWLW